MRKIVLLIGLILMSSTSLVAQKFPKVILSGDYPEPSIMRDGKYVGTLTEGDLLWKLKNTENLNFKNTENVKVSDIGIRIKHKSVSINADVESIIRLATTQNFVPVVDDEGIFIGIIKRSDIINYCYNAIKKEKKFL